MEILQRVGDGFDRRSRLDELLSHVEGTLHLDTVNAAEGIRATEAVCE